MARTPDVAGALEAIITRTLKATMGPRLRKVDSQLKRLERRLKKISRLRGRRPKAARAAGRGRGRRGRPPMKGRRRGRRSKR
jgi:hypothetical protein